MKLETLRKLPRDERVAAMCACEDDVLDRLAAEVQGWELERGDYCTGVGYDGEPCYTNYATWFADKVRLTPVFDSHEWNPSTDLNQAWNLANAMMIHRDKKFTLEAFLHTDYFEVHLSMPDPNSIECERWVIRIDNDQATPYARAVTVLAIVGLMGD